MADYENLLDSIDAVIKSNNRREITGQILQNTLHQMVGSLGENYQLAGFATPTLDPNSPDQNVFYITDEAGVYTNFDNITLGNGLSFLMWKNEEWTSKTLDIVTADWVDEHYVSKAFLRKVFQFFDEDGVEIFPNDTESVVDNIKAMCGLWTNEYLSALGLGEGSTIPTTLAALNDVTITNPQDGQALVYDAASLHWVNATIQSGVDMSVVWAALAGATNEQINISHLTTALNDYVTATSLATTLQSYVTTSALATELANYASQSWVETNYVSKAFFNSLFQAQDVNGNAITPNNSGQTTIDRLKILVGAYTEQYLSALGLSSGGGGGGSSTLAGLNDVTITNPQDGQALIYDAQSSHWVNGAAISMSAVWTALAAATSEQINSSHLTSALSGYVTTSALASELANYVTTSSLATTLADYVTTSALATTLADYGSKTWIDNNYVSKAFFNRLFQAFAPLAEGQTEPTQVEPNDTTTTIDNIKAMFGLWTEQYLSALGLSSDAGHSIGVLDDLNDVTISNPQTNQVLKYNGTQWVNAAAPSGASALSGLTDVAISSLADKDLLQWDYATGKWKNVVLSTVMSGYATTSQLANYLPLTGGTISGGVNPNADSTIDLGTATAKYHYIYAHRLIRLQSISKGDTYDSYKLDLPDKSGTIAVTSDIPSLSGYATESWVGNNYLPLSGGTLTGNLTIAKSVSGGVDEIIRNTSNSSNAYSILKMGNDAHEWCGALFVNSSTRTADGGANTFTIRNDYGILRLGNPSYASYFDSNLGVGTSTPAYKLDVNGTFNATTIYQNGVALGARAFDNTSYYPIAGGSSNPITGEMCVGMDSEGQVRVGHDNINKFAYFYWSKTADLIALSDTESINALFYRYNGNNYTIYHSGNLSASTLGAVTTSGIGSYAVTSINGSGTGSINLYVGTTLLQTTSATQNVTGLGEVTASGDYNITNNSSVDRRLHIHNSIDDVYFGLNSAVAYVWVAGNNTLRLGTNSASRIEILGNGNIGIGTTNPLYKLDVNGIIHTNDHIYLDNRLYMDNSNILYCSNSAKLSILACGEQAATIQIRPLAMSYDTNCTTFLSNGNVGISTTSPSYKLHVVGDIYATGGVTALSDIRKKDVTGYELPLNVEQIANAPTIKFLWKDKREEGEQVGTIAQYWQNVLPWVIKDKSGELSMQYGVAALISSITIARKVVDHEQRITELERENADLKQAYSFIKNAYDYLKMDYENLKLKIA